MKIGERGQVTIPRTLREKLGFLPATEIEFAVEGGQLILRKAAPSSPSGSARIRKWIGCLKGEPGDVDQFIEHIRGR